MRLVAVAFGIYLVNGPVVTAQEVSNATSTEASLEVPVTSASEVAGVLRRQRQKARLSRAPVKAREVELHQPRRKRKPS